MAVYSVKCMHKYTINTITVCCCCCCACFCQQKQANNSINLSSTSVYTYTATPRCGLCWAHAQSDGVVCRLLLSSVEKFGLAHGKRLQPPDGWFSTLCAGGISVCFVWFTICVAVILEIENIVLPLFTFLNNRKHLQLAVKHCVEIHDTDHPSQPSVPLNRT